MASASEEPVAASAALKKLRSACIQLQPTARKAFEALGATPGMIEELQLVGLLEWSLLAELNECCRAESDGDDMVEAFISGARLGANGRTHLKGLVKTVLGLSTSCQGRARSSTARALAQELPAVEFALGPAIGGAAVSLPTHPPHESARSLKRQRVGPRSSKAPSLRLTDIGEPLGAKADKLRAKWCWILSDLVATAAEISPVLQEAAATKNPSAACEGLWGKRRWRTLRIMAETLLALEAWMGTGRLFALRESDLVDYLLGRADEPCAKSVPD